MINLKVIINVRNFQFTFIFLLLYINAFGQKMVSYQLSRDLSVETPAEFSISDTLGQKSVQASLDEALVLISKPNEKVDTYVENNDELLNFYENFLQGMMDQTKGTLIKKEPVTINGFQYYKSSFKSNVGGKDKIWTNYSLLINKISYSFLLISPAENTGKIAFFEKQIINSITVNRELTAKDQFNTDQEQSQAYRIGRFIGSTFIYGLIVGVIIFLVLRCRRKQKT